MYVTSGMSADVDGGKSICFVKIPLQQFLYFDFLEPFGVHWLTKVNREYDDGNSCRCVCFVVLFC